MQCIPSIAHNFTKILSFAVWQTIYVLELEVWRYNSDVTILTTSVFKGRSQRDELEILTTKFGESKLPVFSFHGRSRAKITPKFLSLCRVCWEECNYLSTALEQARQKANSWPTPKPRNPRWLAVKSTWYDCWLCIVRHISSPILRSKGQVLVHLYRLLSFLVDCVA